ncbi:hypothetical protein GCM10009535_24280 [Streptomyces thermocarboxydovorans]|uniref:ChsH2 C-terminal OB-fold domain-containing protein n=1 Tax=Streptomyces thermocarboxydovorans TaxID=59298 RepID=A0ABP3SPF9_9ACTN
MPEVLTAPLVVEFPFTRSLGPVQSAFLTGLRERVVLGVRGSDRRVLVPPAEYDPVTAGELRELVEVAPTGTVTTWAWNHAPRKGQPLTTPFAWVLVRLDGADTALLHALDAPGPDTVRTGMRVRIRWAAERTGAITDIACFEPYDAAPAPGTAPLTHHTGEFTDPVTGIVTPARLRVHTAGSVGGSTALVAARVHRTVLAVAFEKSPTPCGGCPCRSPSSSRCWPAPAASSPRMCAPTSGAAAPPTPSAPSSPTRTGATR